MKQHGIFSSWTQLGFFTSFLFLLVAIPYTIYIKATTQQKVVIVNLPQPTRIVHAALPITPPPASTTTDCIAVPPRYTYPAATPAAYLFQDITRQVCFPPALPPFPFTWQAYTDFQSGFTLDTPKNWIKSTTLVDGIQEQIFAADTGSTSATVSLRLQEGQDPYATDTSYLQMPIHRDNHTGVVYTKNASFIAAIFPLTAGNFILAASRMDTSLYAFEHMLDSLKFL